MYGPVPSFDEHILPSAALTQSLWRQWHIHPDKPNSQSAGMIEHWARTTHRGLRGQFSKDSCRLRVRGVYIHMRRWHVCCVQVGGGGFWVKKVAWRGGWGAGGHLLYSLFTRKEHIKMYKETPLSFPKTQNSDPSASSTWLHTDHLFFLFVFLFSSTIENMLFL